MTSLPAEISLMNISDDTVSKYLETLMKPSDNMLCSWLVDILGAIRNIHDEHFWWYTIFADLT